MRVKELDLPGVLLLSPKRWPDLRGYFVETYNQNTFKANAGLTIGFVQDNESGSVERGTVRALHFQLPPFQQTKLVRVLRGSVYDVAVDIRAGSPTYGCFVGVTLDAKGGEQLLVPRGFAHGFCTLEPDTVVAYKVDNFYSRPHDSGIIWNDPTIGITWPVTASEAVLSDKDRKHGTLADFVSPFRYGA